MLIVNGFMDSNESVQIGIEKRELLCKAYSVIFTMITKKSFNRRRILKVNEERVLVNLREVS
jgi:hypothetical protein